MILYFCGYEKVENEIHLELHTTLLRVEFLESSAILELVVKGSFPRPAIMAHECHNLS